MKWPFSVDRTALLVVDLQRENAAGNVWQVADYDQVLTKAARTIDAARSAGIPVVYSRHALEADGSDALRYEARTAMGGPLAGNFDSPDVEICYEVRPQPGDIVFDKQRFSAFHDTKLDIILRQFDTDHLIVLGCWTEACLETTVWDAIFRDYRITLIRDACGSFNSFAHKVAMLDMANWLYAGRIMDSDEAVKAISGAPFIAWEFETPNALRYDASNLDSLYAKLGG
jgi:nicotinamidase-related amidase